MDNDQIKCEGCKAGLTLLVGKHWVGAKVISNCTKDTPKPPDRILTKEDLYKAARMGEEFTFGFADTLKYRTVEQMIDDRFKF